ncbi:MAG: mannose-6-phosphate isomerase, class I [Gemmatimonadaceae bacterium]|nr:mannose-6-phosphate isomerase, class I [Chitinophagaceae bacterium]
MEYKNRIYQLDGKVQYYQWGGEKYIPNLLGIPNDKNQPFAEYWLGAHNNAPAMLEGTNLDQTIADNTQILGQAVATKFGRLPYLLKILDVRDMLSIQVHPDKKSAEAGFERENKIGLAKNAPTRNYKDDNHKPELMAAIGDFWLLHGFKNRRHMDGAIEAVPEFAFMKDILDADGLSVLYRTLMTMEESMVNEILQPVLDRIIPLYQEGKLNREQADFWAARAALTYNLNGVIDRGIFSVYLLNLVFLPAGTAIFQDAGILHAYLEGQNVEIMANSDNVLRGGLTPKHIDVEELMKHVNFEPVKPDILIPQPVNDFERVFRTPAADFELSRIDIAGGNSLPCESTTTDIFLILSGSIVVSAENSIALGKGQSFISFAGTSLRIAAKESCEIYRATVPVSSF